MDQIVTSPSVPSVAPSPDARIVFSGRRGDFLRLLIRGACLELVTLGFYRFWLATDMRRHLWSNTSVDGDSLEYTGTAKELLIGFLFAMAVLLPISLIYFLIGLEAERAQALASVPLILFYVLFGQFAMYRARRYRLSRTIWRGVRFWMNGSGWDYAWRAALWGFLVGITLGLALPWRTAALERFKMRHSFYGDLQGRFDGRGWEFFKRGWWLWLLAWPLVILPFLLPFIYAAYKAIEWRWWINGIRFGEVRVSSDLPRGALHGLYWKVIGWSLLVSTGMSIWVGIVFALAWIISGAQQADAPEVLLAVQHPLTLIGMGLGYVACALAMNVVMRIHLTRDLWQRVVQSAEIHNLAAAQNVSAQGSLTGAIGEGFADSLDIGGF
ncbi:MAG: hypothetical protein JWN71_4906 [Xanthobacteraceae bacterium]|jgi:uncharacterized membrane protein YjgN (DUF898 family)|nr:hypothetical protein [Xanthobacteraceae bacterium]